MMPGRSSGRELDYVKVGLFDIDGVMRGKYMQRDKFLSALDGIGLDWIGLDWIGLDWIGLDWIGLDWMQFLGDFY